VFLTGALIPFTYSITNGVGAGLTLVLIKDRAPKGVRRVAAFPAGAVYRGVLRRRRREAVFS